jgi:hypothetical protein
VAGIGSGSLFSGLIGENVGLGIYSEFTDSDPVVTDMVVQTDTHFMTPLSYGQIVQAPLTIEGLDADHRVESESEAYLLLGSNAVEEDLNDADNLNLSGFTATSIVGALNEVKGATAVSKTLLATVGPVNLKTVTSTTLYTVPTGKTCLVDGVFLRVAAATAANGDAKAQIEVAAASGDIAPDTTLVGMTTVPDGFRFGPKAGGKFGVASAGDAIKINVTSGDTGTALTAYVDLIGSLY